MGQPFDAFKAGDLLHNDAQNRRHYTITTTCCIAKSFNGRKFSADTKKLSVEWPKVKKEGADSAKAVQQNNYNTNRRRKVKCVTADAARSYRKLSKARRT
jgi:hypothetical protein